jgi:hypothetical protein
MNGVAAHHASVPAMDQTSQRVRRALSEQGISIAVFFLVPNSGDATSSVARSLGLQGTRHRELRGTTTLDQELRDATAWNHQRARQLPDG